jgi:hypothetical protein
MSRSLIAGSFGKSMIISFIRNCQTDFQCDCKNFLSLPTLNESFCYSISSPAFDIGSVLDFSPMSDIAPI